MSEIVTPYWPTVESNCVFNLMIYIAFIHYQMHLLEHTITSYE